MRYEQRRKCFGARDSLMGPYGTLAHLDDGLLELLVSGHAREQRGLAVRAHHKRGEPVDAQLLLESKVSIQEVLRLRAAVGVEDALRIVTRSPSGSQHSDRLPRARG